MKHLVDTGHVVIRIGDASMKSTIQWEEELNFNYFDYALSDLKSELMDCYILSSCKFMIGCASGPNCIPPLFHKNCVTVNWYNPTNGPYFMKGDLCTFKRYYYKKNGEVVPFEKIVRPPFRHNLTKHELDIMGIELRENTSCEILQTVVEYLDCSPISAEQIFAKEALPTDCFSVGAQGNFSKVSLQPYSL